MYWKREVLKSRAKAVLSKTYWYTFLVCLISSILGGDGISFDLTTNISDIKDMLSGISSGDFMTEFTDAFSIGSDLISLSVIPAVIVGFIIGFAVSIAFKIFVSNPIEAGKCRYLYYNAKSPTKITAVFSGFQQNYLKTVATLLVRDLIIAAGFIMFIIPGIILLYALRMVPYIIAENPGIDTRRALSLSLEMTRSQKLDMFVLDLSFLGWIFLGVLALGIGVLFVIPYIESTEAELYGALRRRAAVERICTADEIGAEYFV